MIFTFDYPHKVGTVCGPHCQVCATLAAADGRDIEKACMTDEHGMEMPLQPLVIRREATYEEQVAEMLADGATSMPAKGKYYYDISTD